jgi:predicted transcriptional regulator
MAYYLKTPIGRDLPIGLDLNNPHPAALRAYQRDSILKALYDDHYAIFSDGETPTSLRLLAEGVGMDQRRTRDICDVLSSEGLVEQIPIGAQRYYKITSRGIEFVETAGGGEVAP